MNKNGYSTVRSWRDDVSKSLGGLEKGIENIEKQVGGICKVQKLHDDRIEKLELQESNRTAVHKRMMALYAFVVAIVTTAANIAWMIVK